MKVSIEFADGTTHEATVKASDIVAFERRYELDWAAVQKTPRLEHTLFLAWSALRRAGDTTDDFDTWLDTGVDLADDYEAAAGPLDSPPSSA